MYRLAKRTSFSIELRGKLKENDVLDEKIFEPAKSKRGNNANKFKEGWRMFNKCCSPENPSLSSICFIWRLIFRKENTGSCCWNNGQTDIRCCRLANRCAISGGRPWHLFADDSIITRGSYRKKINWLPKRLFKIHEWKNYKEHHQISGSQQAYMELTRQKVQSNPPTDSPKKVIDTQLAECFDQFMFIPMGLLNSS